MTGVEEFNRDKSDVLSPPIPTAGTLPSSPPDPEVVVAVSWVTRLVGVMEDAPVAAARRGRSKGIGLMTPAI